MKLTIPGKVLLAGEYAILKTGIGLAASVDVAHEFSLEFGAQNNRTLSISSSLLEKNLEVSYEELNQESHFAQSYRLLAKPWIKLLPFIGDRNLEFGIKTHDTMLGMGRSSAILLATYFAAAEIGLTDWGLDKILSAAVADQREIQVQSSGYDSATQLLGGIVKFNGYGELKQLNAHKTPLDPTKLNTFCHLYSGGKGSDTATEVVSNRTWLAKNDLLDRLCKNQEVLSSLIETSITRGQIHPNLFQTLKENRLIFSGCPNEPKELVRELNQVEGCDTTWSYKLSGAGGEDAILVFGLDESLTQVDSFLDSHGWSKSKYKFSTAHMEASH